MKWTQNLFFQYIDSPNEIQWAVRNILYISIGLIITGILVIILNIVDNFSYLSIFSTIFAQILLVIVLLFLKNKHYHISKTILSLTAITYVNFLEFTISKSNHYLEISQLCSLQIAAMMIISMVIVNIRIIAIYAAISISSLYLYYFVKLKFGLMPLEWIYIYSLITSTIVEGIAISMSFILLNMLNKRLRLFEIESTLNSERFYKIKNIVESTKESLGVGNQLVKMTDNSVNNADFINKNLEKIKIQLENISSESKFSKTKTEEVEQITIDTIKGIEKHIAAINDFMNMSNQIIDSVEQMVKVSNVNKDQIDKLVMISQKGEEDITISLASIEKLKNNSSAIMEIIGVIKNIADQTQILALNAEIEASHAGEFGKGFTVVSNEIRKLADKTFENVGNISETLQVNIDNIVTASEKNITASNSFQEIYNQIKEASASIHEIINGMNSFASNIKDTLGLISMLNNSSEIIRNSSGAMHEKLKESNNGFIKTSAFIDNVFNDTINIVKSFEEIVKILHEVNLIGNQNISQLKNVADMIEKIE
jgi:methyl-accepting chemotaxis protein